MFLTLVAIIHEGFCASGWRWNVLLQPSTLCFHEKKTKIHKKQPHIPSVHVLFADTSQITDRFTKRGFEEENWVQDQSMKRAWSLHVYKFAVASCCCHNQAPPLGRVIIDPHAWFQDGSTNSQTWNPSHPSCLARLYANVTPDQHSCHVILFLMLPVI